MFLEILRPESKTFAHILKGAPFGNQNAAGPHRMGGGRDVPRATKLSKADRAIETRLANKVGNNYRESANEYQGIKDTNNGQIINTDTARELSPDYLADRTKAAAVHEPASHFVK